MAEEKDKSKLSNTDKILLDIGEKLVDLETATNERISKLKKCISDFLVLGNEFAFGSLQTALKNI